MGDGQLVFYATIVMIYIYIITSCTTDNNSILFLKMSAMS